MSAKILFVFEGEKTECRITASMGNFFVNENAVIECAYCSTIYQMYKEIIADEDLDTFALLQARNQNLEILKDYSRDDFAEIYMFFDYDGHDTLADDDRLKDLLAFFDEETDKGKLYISYPMVESLKHISDNPEDFKTLKVKCKEKINYKNLVHVQCSRSLLDFTAYNKKHWVQLIEMHLKKMNLLVKNDHSLPVAIIGQMEIFDKQLSKYITVDQTVSVLSSFPVFLFDYYGHLKIKTFLE